MITICKSFTFDAAHRLDKLPRRHKCHALHGHTYRVDIVVEGDMDDDLRWLIDYCEIADAWAPLNRKLDHQYLNDVDGLGHPTTEALALWIFERLSLTLQGLKRVRVHESTTTWAEVTGAINLNS